MRTQSFSAITGLALLLAPNALAQQLTFVSNIPGTFIDISGIGTPLSLPDDGEVDVPTTVGNSLLPAGIVRVGSNGGVRFSGPGINLGSTNGMIPSAGAFSLVSQSLLPFWDDINTVGGIVGEVYWAEVAGTLVVQWDNVGFFNTASTERATFQLQLHASGPAMAQFIYQDVLGVRAAGGASATIGYQSGGIAGNDVQWSFNTASVTNGTVLSLTNSVTPNCRPQKDVLRQSLKLHAFHFRVPDGQGGRGEVVLGTSARPNGGYYSHRATAHHLPGGDQPWMKVKRSKRYKLCNAEVQDCDLGNDDCRWYLPYQHQSTTPKLYSDWVLYAEGPCNDQVELALNFMDLRRPIWEALPSNEEAAAAGKIICAVFPPYCGAATNAVLAIWIANFFKPEAQISIGKFAGTVSLPATVQAPNQTCLALSETIRDKLAEVSVQTEVAATGYFGNSYPDTSPTSGFDTCLSAHCIGRFGHIRFAQTGCDRLELVVLLCGGIDHFATPGTSTELAFYIDADNDANTGDAGAEYRVDVLQNSWTTPDPPLHSSVSAWNAIGGFYDPPSGAFCSEISVAQRSIRCALRFTDVGVPFAEYAIRAVMHRDDTTGSGSFTLPDPTRDPGCRLVSTRVAGPCPGLEGLRQFGHETRLTFDDIMATHQDLSALVEVRLTSGGPPIPLSFDWTSVPSFWPFENELRVTPLSGNYSPGMYTMTIQGIENTCGAAVCGPIIFGFCIEERAFRTKGFGGSDRNLFLVHEPIFVAGTGFSGTSVEVHVVHDATLLDGFGSQLIDQTVGLIGGGVTTVPIVSGALDPTVSLGGITKAGEYVVVADTDGDGLWGPDDRTIGLCDIGLIVTAICPFYKVAGESWWPLDEEAGGVWTADYVNGHKGELVPDTLGALPGSIVGVSGQALEFNGGQRVSVPHSDALDIQEYDALSPDSADFSIAGWIKTVDPLAVLVSKRGLIGFELLLTGGELQLVFNTSSDPAVTFDAGSSAVADGQWHHFAVVVDRDSFTSSAFYVDGVLSATFDPTSYTGSLANAAAPLTMGHDLDGALDEIALYDEALGAEEVALLFAAGASSQCASDCNGNHVLDELELSTGSGQDCNRNGQLDECDIATGVSLDVDLNGVPDECQLGSPYCSGNPNSTGLYGRIWAYGSPFVADNMLTLAASSLPNNANGFFLTSLTQGFTPNPGGSLGVLCIGGAIGRYTGSGQVKNTGSTGAFVLLLNLTQIPTPTGFVSAVAGETRYFQAWHRDSVGGTSVSNFTNGLLITFQ